MHHLRLRFGVNIIKIHILCKNYAKLFLSEISQISTTCEIFWQKDGKEDKLMSGALIFHLT